MKKTKYGDYVTTIPIPTFLYEVSVVFTDDLQKSVDSRTVVFKNSLSGAEQGARALHVATLEGKSYLFFRNGRLRATGEEWAAPGIVAHEAYHAVNAMLVKWAGVKQLDEEVVAYHLTYLVNHIHKFKSKVEEALNEPIHTAQGESFGLQRLQS